METEFKQSWGEKSKHDKALTWLINQANGAYPQCSLSISMHVIHDTNLYPGDRHSDQTSIYVETQCQQDFLNVKFASLNPSLL